VQRVFLLPETIAPLDCGVRRHGARKWLQLGVRVAEVLAGQVSCRFAGGCEPAKSGLNAQFATENAYGLTDALAKREPIRSFAQPLSCPRLWLVSSGSPAKMGKLTMSDRMRERMTESGRNSIMS